MEWASDFSKLDPEVRREAGFFTAIGFSHTKYVAGRSPRGVADNDQPTFEQAETYDSTLSIVFTNVVDFDCDAPKDFRSVFEIQTSV